MLERLAHRTAFRWGSEYMSFKTHFSELKATPGTAPISCTRLVNLSLFSPLKKIGTIWKTQPKANHSSASGASSRAAANSLAMN